MPQDPILQAFDRVARRQGDGPLVVADARSASVDDVHHLSTALADRFERQGVEPGMLVGLCTGNGPAFLAGLLALRRRRAAAVPLEPQDGPDARARILEHLGAAFDASAPAWADGPGDFTLRPLDASGRRAVDEDIAVVKLTSGSTGTPRGILAPSDSLVADESTLRSTMGLVPDECILAAIPMTHSYGLTSVVMPALTQGSRLVVPDPRSPFSGLQAVRAFEVSFLPTAPAFLSALLRTSSKLTPAPSLKLVISAGAPLSPETAIAFRGHTGLPVHVFYGASEAGGISYDREGNAAEQGTVGTPVDGARITIQPAQTGGDDDAGTLIVESPAVARGYFPDPDERLGNGRFQTGDLARWRGGEIELCGRTDDLINIRGRKVNPLEVERVLTGHTGVRDAVVFKLGDDEAVERLRAVVECDPPHPSIAELLAWCREHLPEYKIPKSLLTVDALPRTVRGKLDRSALKAMAARG